MFFPSQHPRKVAARRRELGLTRAQLAGRAGLAASYLAYLEEHLANVRNDGLMRLADALATAPGVLLGCGAAGSSEAGAVGISG